MSEDAKKKKKVPEGKRFSSDYQPTPEAKSEGKKKKRLLKDLAEVLVNEKKGRNRAKAICKSIGIDHRQIEHSPQMVMTLRQIEKAILLGDTVAYKAAMERIVGPVDKKLDITSGGEKVTIPNAVIFKNI